ncbi:hypothetical protein AYO38_05060 [bacterium SCGC AG-212-C10]|nr:hypothetical protein AYO38_05060 [bacterium SCGC AG-212-C10]
MGEGLQTIVRVRLAHQFEDRVSTQSVVREKFGSPPLENGDRMSRIEFARRYSASPEDFRAELVEGVVFVGGPVPFDTHAEPHGAMAAWLGIYRARTDGVRAGISATVRLDLDNEPQPDSILMRIDGGSARLVDGYIEGPPELVVEISASTVSIDMNQKLHAYRRNGVQEYIVWRVFDGAIDWFSLEEGEYVALAADPNGVVSSKVFPGLRLNVQAMLDGDMEAVLAELRR